ncbi:MAG: biopolymer transporter ExbD [Victivallales bacterium]|nr:biopolymer transporter ExbD [Victivallales bacterium]
MLQRRYTVNVRSRLKYFHGRPDMTAMINVLFLLLIFIMLSSSFVKVSGIKVELPELESSRSLSIGKLVVTVDKDNQIFFKNRNITWDELKQNLVAVSSAAESATIILRADSKAPFGLVARIMALAEGAGLNVFIATASPLENKDDGHAYVDER